MRYQPPRSEHASRYARFVLARRRIEAARARVWWWERMAKLAAGLTLLWLVVAAAELLRGDMGWIDYFTVATLGWLAISQWRTAYLKARRARRIVAKREARM